MAMQKIISLLCIGLVVLACNKRDKVGVPEFNVTTPSTTYKLGDTIVFNFSGNAQYISFWSGMPGHEYQHRDRLFNTGYKLLVRFNTFQSFNVQDNFTVWVSNDFNGTYDTTNVKKATWTDITSRATLSKGADQVQSGTLDLSEFTDGNKSATIAFRYKGIAASSQSRWVVRTFNADYQAPDGTVTPVSKMDNTGWKAVSFQNPVDVWSITSAQLLMRGNNQSLLDDDWVLSRSYNPNAASPDKGEGIKDITFNLDKYVPDNQYTKPGTYKATFVASNASYENREQVVKEITITITP